MKYTVLIVTILIGFVSSAQTKEETVDWLNQKFVEFKNVNYVKIEIEKDESNQEKLTLLSHYGSLAFMYKFNSSQVYAVSLYKAEAGNYNLKIIPKSGIDEGLFEFDENRNPILKETKVVNEINLVFENTLSSGNKMKKALVHLINLTGGDISSDDLFKD